MKIAVIEDEELIRDSLKELLELEFPTDTFKSIKEFLKTDKKYDVIIGDIYLPDGNLLAELNKHPNLIKESLLIIISGAGDIENIKKSFEIGAVDFVKKPFEFEEILLRINRFIKKSDIKLSDNIYYSPSKKSLIVDDNIIELTFKESKFLELLIEKNGAYATFKEIEAYVWGEPIVPNTLAALVKRIRKKLNKDLIESKRYLGYRLIMSS